MDSSDLNAWLVFLDVNYLGGESINLLSSLDINNIDHQDFIIRTAMECDVLAASDEYRDGIRLVLDEVPLYLEAEVRALIAETEMPFDKPLENYQQFFCRVRQYFFP